MRVAILFDPGAEDWTPEDVRGVMKAVDEIGGIFASMGHEIRKVPVRHDMRWFQVARRADLAFNLCEGVHGKSEWEEHVVGTLEFAGVPVTGASLWTLAACRRKPIANALLQQAGLPIPRWTVAQGKIEDDFPLPAIVKPASEDASAGLDRGSVVSDRKALRARGRSTPNARLSSIQCTAGSTSASSNTALRSSRASHARSKYRVRISMSASTSMECSRRAGTHTARSGGTSQRPFGVVTCMVPRAA